ncbi:hypothetical protein HALA3H3_950126 [Halomonas sp. A3H3]|nr:conserved hypothetical protein [Halomonas sp. 156]CAD5264404.1 conserved hypothetical protein [Halomonas sp. I3]CAD5285290.1 conserved hypothetical protein [Halomonas sp. 113]CAD5286852.1 conserved hypothetical protein [Halomonas sp. 59]CDG55839.1 hypothetical protein HALA3H3_950126 [Halomonas sp. A3H3]VXB32517.1 conserved hypothetical protein [Halomonas titanicae]
MVPPKCDAISVSEYLSGDEVWPGMSLVVATSTTLGVVAADAVETTAMETVAVIMAAATMAIKGATTKVHLTWMKR